MGTPEIRTLLSGYVAWYNAERPHQGLDGVTPPERATRKQPAKVGRESSRALGIPTTA